MKSTKTTTSGTASKTALRTASRTATRTATHRNRTPKTRICQHLLSFIMAFVLAAGMLVGFPATAAYADPPSSVELIFSFTVRTPSANTEFNLPISGAFNSVGMEKLYDWAINWGDGSAEQNVKGFSSEHGGIPHTYAAAGDYTISITPRGPTEAWLAAFGFHSHVDPSDVPSREMIIGVRGPIRPEMTRTYEEIVGIYAPLNFEWSYTFSSCTNLTQAPTFEGWEGISRVGSYFAMNMFAGCSSLTTLPAGFNLPQNLTRVGMYFALNMFVGCLSLTTLPAGFNLPQNITQTGSSFANSMFNGCANLTTLPAGFTFPQGITSADSSFASSMFAGCSSLTALPAGFNLPQSISTAGDFFAYQTFAVCSSLTALPAGFNLPQGITSAGAYFATGMFQDCFSLTTLPAGFNLPQNITTTGESFASRMLLGAGSATFQFNNEFRFPAGIPAETPDAFARALNLSGLAPVQNRTATSIIGNCPTPADPRVTFSACFSDLGSVPVNWGGQGFIYTPVGAPGSGDIDGDGIVTMNEAMIAARVAIGAVTLGPEQTAAIDMDGDGVITMTDALRVMRKAIGL